MHNKTISWNDNWILIFIWFMGRLLEPSTSSSSSFIIASFLIQMLRWIRGSSRVVLQELSSSYSSFLEGSSLDGERLIFSCSHLLFSSFFFLCVLFPESAKSNHFLLAHIFQMNESHDSGRPFKVAITTSTFFTSSFTSSICFLGSYSDVCSFLQIAWSRNQTSLSISLGKTLVVQVDPSLNQQWSSWPWPSSSGVRLWASEL